MSGVSGNPVGVPDPEPPPLGVPAGWVQRAVGDVIRADEPYSVVRVLLTATHREGFTDEWVITRAHHPIYTAPPPEPKPWEDIPEGRENAALLSVNGAPGRYFRKGSWVCIFFDGEGGGVYACNLEAVTSVEPLTAVPSELVERARDYLPKHPSMLGSISGGIVRDLAKAGESE